MTEIRDHSGTTAADCEMQAALHHFLSAASSGTLVLQLPRCLGAPAARGAGHFHLAPELFLQISGWSEFRFPHGVLRLRAGHALVVPPQMRHAERVGVDDPAAGQAFGNLVVYAEAPMLTCHLARELHPGEPGIAHLRACHHAQAARVHDWLCDAARLGLDESAPHQVAPPPGWAEAQGRALVAAAVAGVLRALHDGDAGPATEPALVSRLRVLIHNQLGDPALSVQSLARQCDCSADHLSQLFRRASGEGLVVCINRLRIERAARLLRETTLAGKEIAWACGFAAPSYFIHSFRQRHGMTPRAWRDAARRADPAAVSPRSRT